MTRFSARHAVAMAATICAILVPATIRQNFVPEYSECSTERALLDPRAFHPEARPITDASDVHSAIDRGRLIAEVRDPSIGIPMYFAVIRYYHFGAGLMQPPHVLPGFPEPDQLVERPVEADGSVLPTTWAYEERRDRTRTTAYFMTYDGRVVESAFWTRVRGSLQSLVDGPLPITLFVVAAAAHESRQERVEAELADWTRNAWRHYRAVCPGPPKPVAPATARAGA